MFLWCLLCQTSDFLLWLTEQEVISLIASLSCWLWRLALHLTEGCSLVLARRFLSMQTVVIVLTFEAHVT